MRLHVSGNPHSVPHPSHGSEAIYYASHYLHRKGFIGSVIGKFLKRLNQFIFHVNIPPEVEIGKGLELCHGGFGVVIHKDTKIGKDAIIFHNVTIGNGGARIGDRVYIGAGAAIIGNVSLGDDVTIGANTVVNFHVPSGATVVGASARIIPFDQKSQNQSNENSSRQ